MYFKSAQFAYGSCFNYSVVTSTSLFERRKYISFTDVNEIK